MLAHERFDLSLWKVGDLCINLTKIEYHETADLSMELHDVQPNGKERPWDEKKRKSMIVADAYKHIGKSSKAARMSACGDVLEFRRYSDGTRKLHMANFCKIRLCPLCNWRRSRKIFAQMSQIMDVAQQNQKNKFVFLTLTVRNCKGWQLSDTIDKLMNGFNLLMKRREIKRNIKGCFRALEVTHNLDKKSDSYDTYHPHLHCILMVDESYFCKENELSWNQRHWRKLWQESIDVQYDPWIYLESVSEQDSRGAALEVAKYTVKDADYLVFDDDEMTRNTIKFLDDGLFGRRLISYSGEFAKIRKQLNLDDAETGDLVNTGDEPELRQDLEYVIERYKWNVGYGRYLKT